MTPLAFRVVESKFSPYGMISLFFALADYDDKNNGIIVQMLLDITSKEELDNYVKPHTLNIDNFNEEHKEAYKQMLNTYGNKDGELAKDVYCSDFQFSLVTTEGKPDSYKIEAFQVGKDTENDKIRDIVFSRGTWLQLSMFLYWMYMDFPIAIEVFEDKSLENAEMREVKHLEYNGSCDTNYMGNQVIMGHFTLYDSVLSVTGGKGFNIPYAPSKIRTPRNHMPLEVYWNKYGKDDTLSMDRMFIVFSPMRCAAVLTGDNKTGKSYIYTLSDDVVNKYHWLELDKHIYL